MEGYESDFLEKYDNLTEAVIDVKREIKIFNDNFEKFLKSLQTLPPETDNG